MKNDTNIDYFTFAYFCLSDKQKKDIETIWHIKNNMGKKHKEISESKSVPVSRSRVTYIINYKLPEVQRQLDNWFENSSIMFRNVRNEVVYEYVPEN